MHRETSHIVVLPASLFQCVWNQTPGCSHQGTTWGAAPGAQRSSPLCGPCTAPRCAGCHSSGPRWQPPSQASCWSLPGCGVRSAGGSCSGSEMPMRLQGISQGEGCTARPAELITPAVSDGNLLLWPAVSHCQDVALSLLIVFAAAQRCPRNCSTTT